MNFRTVLILFLIFGCLNPVCVATKLTISNSTNTTTTPGNVLSEHLISGNTFMGQNLTSKNSNSFTNPLESNSTVPGLNQISTLNSGTGDDKEGYQAGSDMITKSVTEDIPRKLGDSVFDQFGGVRKWLVKFYTWNIKPWEIIGVEKFYNNNLLLVFPAIILFLLGATLAKFIAIANPQAVKEVFGETTWAYKDAIGGTLFMLIGAFSGGAFYAFMLLLDLVNLYLMFQVMETIEPSMNNAGMYFGMAIITVLLFVFFVYRQMWIVAGYALSPVYGVLFASGCFSDFTDNVGETFLRAMMMQPLSILIMVVWLIVIKGIALEIYGTSVWQASESGLPYLALFTILLAGCCWCVWGKFSIMRRAKQIVSFGKMVI